MSKFKVGQAKTVGGYDAVIFEITDERIFGKLNDGGWRAISWSPNSGKHMADGYSLLPNVEPMRDSYEISIGENPYVNVPMKFRFKKVKVTLEEILDDPKN